MSTLQARAARELEKIDENIRKRWQDQWDDVNDRRKYLLMPRSPLDTMAYRLRVEEDITQCVQLYPSKEEGAFVLCQRCQFRVCRDFLKTYKRCYLCDMPMKNKSQWTYVEGYETNKKFVGWTCKDGHRNSIRHFWCRAVVNEEKGDKCMDRMDLYDWTHGIKEKSYDDIGKRQKYHDEEDEPITEWSVDDRKENSQNNVTIKMLQTRKQLEERITFLEKANMALKKKIQEKKRNFQRKICDDDFKATETSTSSNKKKKKKRNDKKRKLDENRGKGESNQNKRQKIE